MGTTLGLRVASCFARHLRLRIPSALRGARELLAFALAEHMHDVAGLQAGASPVKPAVLLAGEFTEFDVITRGGS